MAAAPADLGPAILPPGPSELRGVIQYSNFYLPKTYTKRIIIRFFDRDASAPHTPQGQGRPAIWHIHRSAYMAFGLLTQGQQ